MFETSDTAFPTTMRHIPGCLNPQRALMFVRSYSLGRRVTSSLLTMQSLVVTICTTCFNIKKLYFAHAVYLSMCFMWFSQSRPITSINSINRLVFIIKTDCDFSEPIIQRIPMALSPGVKWPWHDIDQSSASNARVNEYSYTIALPVCLHSMHRDKTLHHISYTETMKVCLQANSEMTSKSQVTSACFHANLSI